MSKNFTLKILFATLGICSVFISVSSLFHPSFFRVHDYTQGARIVEMFRGFQDGQIPVRWSKNFGFGYGMPTFLFYAPFPYVVGAAIYWLSHNVVFALKMVWLIPSIVSFVGMYRLVQKKFGRLAGIVAAASFTLAPYRAVDLYVRGAVGEVWAIALFPWLLLAIDDWFDAKSRLGPKLSILTGLLFVSHNLMAMFFAPVMALFGGLTWVVEKKRKTSDLFWLSLNVFIGVGLSAFYILPALAEKDATQIDSRILSGYFHYSQHFVYIRQFFQENWKYGGSVWGPNDDLSFFLGYGQLLGIGLLVAVSAWIIWRKFLRQKKNVLAVWHKVMIRHRQQLPLVFLAFIGLPISLFFCTAKSTVFWDMLSLLQTAQFPWRFLSLTICFLAILNGFSIALVKNWNVKVVLSGFFLVMYSVAGVRYFHPEQYLDHPEALYYEDAHRIRFEMSETWPDFLPKGFADSLTASDQRFDIPSNPEEEKNVEIVVDRSHQLLLKTHFSLPQQVIIHIADFPGWKLFLNDQKVDTQLSADGLLTIGVPAGEQWVAAEFTRTNIRQLGDLVSLLCFAILLYSQIVVTRQKVTV